MVGSTLLGAVVAELLTLRATYLLTLVPLAVAGFLLLRFREPQLHRHESAEPFADQLRGAYAALLQRGALRRVVGLLVLAALLVQSMIEFGPWWLVVLQAPTVLYGMHWAALTAALGIGGMLGGIPRLTHGSGRLLLTAAAMSAAAGLLAVDSLVPVAAAQVVLTLAMVAISIPLTRQLHDALDSTVRASVASGVEALSWLTFVPFALGLGQLTHHAGVSAAGGLLMIVTGVVAVLMIMDAVRSTAHDQPIGGCAAPPAAPTVEL